ncbi:hypothetical protein ACR4XJ_05475 [Nitratidesulfovibrio sp. D1]|uniref:hypothetical protein n=1 Tax=Nitratidesulfovibrio sp. D1 TaxID=3440151 RepID=UPI003EC1283B
MLNMKYLDELEEYLTSERLEDEFEYSPEERRHEILEFLERLMDVADKADAAATRLIFRKSQLGALMGNPPEK